MNVTEYAMFVTRLTAGDNFGDIEVEPGANFPWLDEKAKARLLHRACSGMLSELGEANQIVHKAVYRGHDLEYRQVAIELGDVLWNLVLGCNAIGLTLDEVMDLNVSKLTERYPDGYSYKADVERSK